MSPESEVKKIIVADKKSSFFVFERSQINTIKNSLGKNNNWDGYWAVRESRYLGFITLCLRKKKGIFYYRLGYQNGQWVRGITDNQVESNLRDQKFHPMDSKKLEGAGEKLLDYLLKEFDLAPEKMICPKKNQASQEYISIEPFDFILAESAQVHDNPLIALKEIIKCIEELETELARNNFDKLEHFGIENIQLSDLSGELLSDLKKNKLNFNEESAKLEDIFHDWLYKHFNSSERDNLHSKMTCPILLTLFQTPRFLQESGKVFDEKALLFQDPLPNKCPITRKDLNRPSVYISDYRFQLAECLHKFVTLVNAYHQARKKNEKEDSIILKPILFKQDKTSNSKQDEHPNSPELNASNSPKH